MTLPNLPSAPFPARCINSTSPTGKFFMVQGVNVVHVEVDHNAMGVPGLAAHVVVAADGEPQSAPLERDEVGALGVGFHSQRYAVEFPEAGQVAGPDDDAVHVSYHAYLRLGGFRLGFHNWEFHHIIADRD